MAGRKSKLTKDLIREASTLIKAGNYTETVCQYLGIHKSTWYRWMAEGEQSKGGLKAEFYQEVKGAESFAEISFVNIVRKAAQEGNWQAAMTILERKFPDRWGRQDKQKVEHSGGVTNRNMDLSSVSVEELRELAKQFSGTD